MCTILYYIDLYFYRHSTKIVALTITANNVIAINPVNNNNNLLGGNKKSKFLEMDEQEHQVLHYYKPKLYDNAVDLKTSTEDDQQLKKHLSVLSSDSIASSEPSLIDMNEDEAERFLRSMQILLNRREMMDEQLGHHPTRYLSQPIIYDRTSMANNAPPVTLAFDQQYPQKMFAAPNRSVHATDDARSSVTEQKQQQPHPLLLQPTNDNNAWGDDPPIMAYSNSPFTTQRRRHHHTVSSHHSSIESLEMSEQL